MILDRRRLALDALTVLLAAAGVTLVVIGGGPPVRPERADVASAGAAPAGAPPAGTGTPSAGAPNAAGAGTPADSAPPPPPGPPAPAAAAPATSGFDGFGPAPLGRSTPVRLTIPAIGVDTPLLELGLHADGTIETPPVAGGAPAGWYRNLASPGEVGPAVVLGHVDSARDGPAVFFRLRELRAGDRVAVKRADGRTAVFTVDRVAEYAKAAFPTAEVYGSLDHSGLRLVTCGGEFDRYRREYKGNVIAFASLSSVA
ncbi:class F sortase [Virgisporangium aurantiacum]|uniref:Sortase family protein n=1 Tax=Virgisporangium aurantiacum TaxID=175570 RepID=A0A8J4DZ75_9ACTN|nr:class F sortase [Virgisporangium aurantiacum]GIJ55421.1 hypothetical protein Vau01_029370 [Virgisporangium aurantiacum]